jgi:hypothetical protein
MLVYKEYMSASHKAFQSLFKSAQSTVARRGRCEMPPTEECWLLASHMQCSL